MKMPLCCVTSMAVFCSLLAAIMGQNLDSNQNSKDREFPAQSITARRKRSGPSSLIAVGVRAWIKLTDGATRIEPWRKNVKIYVKRGNALSAEKQFWSLNPQNVMTLREHRVKMPDLIGLTGQVGDRTVDLFTASSGTPIIKLFRTGQKGSNKILEIIRYEP